MFTEGIKNALIRIERMFCEMNGIYAENQGNLGGSYLTRIVSRKTSQGGIISPTLWMMVIAKILRIVGKKAVKLLAYDDDSVVLILRLSLLSNIKSTGP